MALAKERFSLLLLEPGEIYFEDYSVFYYPGNVTEPEALRRKQKGRLKICSKSILFDPKDVNQPILKFPLRDCSYIEKWTGSLLSKLGNKGNVIHLKCDLVIEMLTGCRIAPYEFRKGSKSYLFNFNYVNVDDCLPQMCQLRRAASLPGAEQASMVTAIVLSRQSRLSFNTSWLEDLYEKIVLKTTGNRITPLVTNPGRILLTSSRLYFQPYNNAEPWPVLKVRICDVKRAVKRRFLLRHVGLELYCSDNSSLKHLFLSFKTQAERDELYLKLTEQSGASRLQDTRQENMTLLWQNGVISNYEYLLYINSLADRSFNDMTQYPVFPWVIADYTSESLDLSNPSVYRDLTKPIGALNEDRLQKLKERYSEMSEPRFLYGSHYSTPGFVLYYLVRKFPQLMLCLQNGRFDHPDRMFNSVPDTWRNVTTNTSDFKELIPEFFEPEEKGDFLLNVQGLDFGIRQDGTRVGDVELPPWAESPSSFVRKLREALESEYVSNELHHWIDLIFGYKQRGEEAIKADNVFYYLTYEGSLDLDSIKDINERYSLEVQIMEFGQVPKQIFLHPHPQRHLPSPLPENILTSHGSVVIEDSELQMKTTDSDEIDGCVQYMSNSSGKWNRDMSSLSAVCEYKLHKDIVTDICITADLKNIFSVSQDSLLKMYSLTDKKQLRSINVSNMALSSSFLMGDGRTVVVGSWDNYVYMYNIEYGKLLETTMAHDDAVTDICWNNGLLATASWDSTAKIWHYQQHCGLKLVSSAELLAELDHETGVSSVSLSPDNALLASGTSGGHVSLWELSTFSLVGQYRVHIGMVFAVDFSPDGKKVASCGRDHTLKILDVKTGTQLFNKNVGEELRCFCWDGITMITGGQHGNIMIWDLVKAQLVMSLPLHRGPVTCIDVSNDGSLVATGGEDQKVMVWRSAQM